ncbi:MAG: hypothetical protein GF383_12725 [Candidatus Lokiarchaeota archaeon]|nr:hypothetical protein [Candidatus Lokiarchaeota archaeon]MBD3341922.1 hypothetical protein [Candidatus Lokiarchaeota archaeon]
MGKDPEVLTNKAELYYENERYKKAGKYYDSAGDIFFDEEKFQKAQNCYFYAAKSFIYEEKFDKAIEILRKGGNVSLFMEEFSEALKFFKGTLRYLPSFRDDEDRNYYYSLFSALTYFCLFIEGKLDQGLELIKGIKKKVNYEYFKENQFINLVKFLAVAIRDNNAKFLQKVRDNFEDYELLEAELYLLRRVLLLAQINVNLKILTSFDQEKYTTKDLITLTLKIDTKPLVQILEDTFFKINVSEIFVDKLNFDTSDNLTSQNKPDFSKSLPIGDQLSLEYVLKPHFQVDEPYIGPFTLFCRTDKEDLFIHELKDVLRLNIVSPPPSLEISLKNLKPPLIGKSFPLEILIENKSEGDALEVELNVEFPNELKVTRGTTTKQIYSLNVNDDMTWQLNLTPMEAGEFEIIMNIKFKDSDGKNIEDVQSFPFEIKL